MDSANKYGGCCGGLTFRLLFVVGCCVMVWYAIISYLVVVLVIV